MAPARRPPKTKARTRSAAKKPAAPRPRLPRFYKIPVRRPPPGLPTPPPPFRISRELGPGNYPLSVVFPGFLDTALFSRYPGPADRTRALAEGTSVQIVPQEMWMYIAPHVPPPFAEEVGWKPFTSRTNCIVVGRKHLAESPAVVLYMDIYHEFSHILQREAGRELWDDAHDYVDSPTELEAYRFVIHDAHLLGVPDSFLRTYLEVEWVSPADHLRLLKNLGLSPPRAAGRSTSDDTRRPPSALRSNDERPSQ
jgi:hypothetical protein